MTSILGFAVCAIIIFFAGKKLSFYGEIIAKLTGWGRAWVGLVLMASVTSLPELITGVSSAAIVESPDLAVGDILGSCAFNLGILALMDAFVPQHKPIFSTASQNHVVAAAMGIVLVGMAGLGLFMPNDFVFTAGLGLTSISFIIVYFISIRILYKFEVRVKLPTVAVVTEGDVEEITLKKAAMYYGLYAGVIIVAALFLPYFAEHIAEITGLGKTFVGTLLLAASTSMPEIAVSLAAVRMGSIDISVGNLLGSNIFNIFILALNDIWYTKGHLLKDANDAHMVSIIFVILMSAVAIIGLSYRAQTKRYWLAWDAALIFGLYLVNLIILYNLTS